MDNRWISQVKRGLKVTADYGLMLVLFVVFALLAMSFTQDGSAGAMPLFSFLIFLVTFYTVYVDMRVMAFKEKRPQYGINPPAHKGLLYGMIGIIPWLLVEAVLMLIKVPDSLGVFQRRTYQGIGGPLYWFARLLGNQPWHYMISFLIIVVIAGLGYFAGYKDFYLVSAVRKKLGIQPKVKKKSK